MMRVPRFDGTRCATSRHVVHLHVRARRLGGTGCPSCIAQHGRYCCYERAYRNFDFSSGGRGVSRLYPRRCGASGGPATCLGRLKLSREVHGSSDGRDVLIFGRRRGPFSHHGGGIFLGNASPTPPHLESIFRPCGAPGFKTGRRGRGAEFNMQLGIRIPEADREKTLTGPIPGIPCIRARPLRSRPFVISAC